MHVENVKTEGWGGLGGRGVKINIQWFKEVKLISLKDDRKEKKKQVISGLERGRRRGVNWLQRNLKLVKPAVRFMLGRPCTVSKASTRPHAGKTNDFGKRAILL